MNKSKEHILKTSLVLFLQKSYKDVTMSEIVKKTGLSKGAFYHYFKSKEDLYRSIIDIFLSYGEADYENISDTTLKEFYYEYAGQLDRSIQDISNLSSGKGKKPVNFFFLMFEAASRFPDFLQKELIMYKRDIKKWTDIIAKARKKGEISSNSTDESLASLFLYCNDGVFMRYINSDYTEGYKKYLIDAYNSIYENIKS